MAVGKVIVEATWTMQLVSPGRHGQEQHWEIVTHDLTQYLVANVFYPGSTGRRIAKLIVESHSEWLDRTGKADAETIPPHSS